MPAHSTAAGQALHGTKIESVSGTPQGSRNAQVIGETVVDSVTNIVYRATATGTGSWVIVGASPSGSAGGDLSGTYPNPTVADVDGATGTLSAAQKVEVLDAGSSVSTRSKINFIDGTNITVSVADNSGSGRADVTINSTGGGMTWTKYTKAYTDFSAAATTNSITLFTLAAKDILHGIAIKHATAFSGGSISAYTVSVGKSGSTAKYAPAFSVFTAVADGNFQMSENFVVESFASGTTIQATATSTGANLNAATAGSVEIWALTSTLAA